VNGKNGCRERQPDNAGGSFFRTAGSLKFRRLLFHHETRSERKSSGNEPGLQCLSLRAEFEEDPMKMLAVTVLAGAGALFAGSANASDFYTSSGYSNPDLLQPVRMVCNDDGRCYRTRGSSRVIIRDSYGYAPRERYIERRGYRDWDDGPRAGVRFRAPGVSIGVGDDRW
jgi:hypothetical protein